jgi:hypothetical protein
MLDKNEFRKKVEAGKSVYRKLLATTSKHEWKTGLSWYLEAHQEAVSLSQQFGLDLEQAVGIIAVLSPMVEWNLNLKIAREFIRSKGKKRTAGFMANYRKAYEILKRKDYSAIRGPKVTAFYETILNPRANHPPVVDTHMIAGFYEGVSYRTDLTIVHGNEFRLQPIRTAIVELAHEYGIRVQEMQAVLWLRIKRENAGFGNQLELWG